jgi:hypothetical protein
MDLEVRELGVRDLEVLDLEVMGSLSNAFSVML